MADGFGVAMAEMEFAGIKFKGGKIFVILTALTTLGGGLWGGFEFYKDYLNMKDKIEQYSAPDLSGFDKRLELLQQETEMITQEMSMIIQEVQLVEQQVKEDARDNSKDLKETVNDLKDDMKSLEEKIDKKIKLALENPLSNMK